MSIYAAASPLGPQRGKATSKHTLKKKRLAAVAAALLRSCSAMPTWSAHVRLKIKAALAACAPDCFLADETIQELRGSTGLTTLQIKKSAENFRSRVNFGLRKHYLACVITDADIIAAANSKPTADNPHPTRFSKEVLSHLVAAMQRHGRMGRFDGGTVLMLMHATGLSAASIRKWASHHRLRHPKAPRDDVSKPRSQRRREQKETMKRDKAAEEAENIRIAVMQNLLNA